MQIWIYLILLAWQETFNEAKAFIVMVHNVERREINTEPISASGAQTLNLTSFSSSINASVLQIHDHLLLVLTVKLHFKTIHLSQPPTQPISLVLRERFPLVSRKYLFLKATLHQMVNRNLRTRQRAKFGQSQPRNQKRGQNLGLNGKRPLNCGRLHGPYTCIYLPLHFSSLGFMLDIM